MNLEIVQINWQWEGSNHQWSQKFTTNSGPGQPLEWYKARRFYRELERQIKAGQVSHLAWRIVG